MHRQNSRSRTLALCLHHAAENLHWGLQIALTSIQWMDSAPSLPTSAGSLQEFIVAVTSHGPDNSSKPEEKLRLEQVDRFILEQIDTVPHLEALLLVWRRRPKTWSVDEMAAQLYISAEQATKILRDLSSRGFLLDAGSPSGQFQYAPSEEQDRLIAEVEIIYSRDLIRISRMIHAKAPSALRDFARAFRFTKEKE